MTHKESRVYPPSYPHDPITRIFDNIYLVHGSIRMGPGMSMNRNMLIVREGDELTLINPVRINEEELKKLDGMGVVRHVVRLGDFHGLDDPFYVDRYQAEFWCQAGQSTYKIPSPTHLVSATAIPPMSDAAFFVFAQAKFPEAALLLKAHKLLVTTDSLQYWADWSYTSPFTKCVLWLMGFRLNGFIGGPWLKRVTPDKASLLPDFERLQTLDFDHFVAAHGRLLRNNAKPMLQAAMVRTFGSASKAVQANAD
ncbi:MAG: hypothetical protein EA349_05595 [Halomonadaceae bacterium]|nr:MAG: hypothetical protein EA349_05595 [Halomonadaceae bacterium]